MPWPSLLPFTRQTVTIKILRPFPLRTVRTGARRFSVSRSYSYGGQNSSEMIKDLEQRPSSVKKTPKRLRLAASVILVSPTNQVLLLKRVETSSSFASAHVFPGGNLSTFHEGTLLGAVDESTKEFQDGTAYRLAAVRETFEESGILLARPLAADQSRSGSLNNQALLHLPDAAREEGRRETHDNKIKFIEWLESQGGAPDLDNLIPFTRWVTPGSMVKRFSTQMYLYMLPLSANSSILGAPEHESVIQTPTHDGGIEHTTATFDRPDVWLAKAKAGNVLLYPPQFYLLHLLSQFLNDKSLAPAGASAADVTAHLERQRSALVTFLRQTPTTPPDRPSPLHVHPTAHIPWAEKVICPQPLVKARLGSRLLGLDDPGPELQESGKGGDYDRVLLVNWKNKEPRDIEVKWRDEVLLEAKSSL
ncbi:hypothetical protein B0T26DRAFT_691046 [Lasiosphaeria miniovina]|uniref:Nudix hydrolase domain-containing protein n=1 Tax=Lasiosphaeria miniovina TaxID=1954250 RepID=A0AA40BJ31_9PEZI|nr:uncharacterized protein B0T26DRAFT_691046 [Lasiosphaeria miniovina]KAK0735179.1 hypothetical protein B0T26DRAFT_691046 [Lasiosphaeria miniovina]